MWILVFAGALALLVFSSNRFIVTAEHIGRGLGIRSFVIGITIVAMGTSLPELGASFFAVARHSGEIVVGNVIGSNITNILLIIGISALMIRNYHVDKNILKWDFPLLVLSALVLIFFLFDLVFTRWEALAFLGLFAVYIFYMVRNRSNVVLASEVNEIQKITPKSGIGQWVWLVVFIAGIYFGSKYTITAVIELARQLSVGTELIALTAVALGTSLPELAVSIAAARRNNVNIITGNIIGSNIFNTLVVMGLPGMFSSLPVPAGILYFSLPVMLLATLAFWAMSADKKVSRANGILLLVFYAGYLGYLFIVR